MKNSNQLNTAAIGSALICMSMFLLPFSTHFFWAISLCVILTLGEILFFSIILSLMVDKANESNKGKYIGINQSIFGLASMLAPMIGNYIYVKQPAFLWYVCGFIGLSSIIIFQPIRFLLEKPKNQFQQQSYNES